MFFQSISYSLHTLNLFLFNLILTWIVLPYNVHFRCNSYRFSVHFNRSVLSNSLWLHELQHARPPCPSPTPTVYSNSCPSVMPSNHLILCCPLLLLPSIFPSIRVFSNEPVHLSQHQVAKVLEFQLQHQSFQWVLRTDLLEDGLVGSPCSPRDSQESSPTQQFKSIKSSVLSSFYCPILSSIHDFWKNHSHD